MGSTLWIKSMCPRWKSDWIDPALNYIEGVGSWGGLGGGNVLAKRELG